jgi:hypothetical protein
MVATIPTIGVIGCESSASSGSGCIVNGLVLVHSIRAIGVARRIENQNVFQNSHPAMSLDLSTLSQALDAEFDPELEEKTRVTVSIFDEYEHRSEGGLNYLLSSEIESQRYHMLSSFL